MSAVAHFKDFVAKTNLRMTKERETIIQAMLEENGHFTVSVLIERLEKKGHQIARSTIYRAIPHLLNSGLIRKAPANTCTDEQIYEPITGRSHHDHLICEMCGEVIEFEENAIEILQEKVAEQYGYKLKKHHLELVGICPACQETIIEKAVNPW